MPRLLDVRPELRAVRPAAQALGLGPRELLHAGPPLADSRRPPPTLESSVLLTCLHEGWAADEAAAAALLRDGGVTLSPAQDRGCVTPLAAIVSPSTPLLVVGDGAGGRDCLHAPVSAVRGADTRMGARDPAVLDRLRHRDTHTAPALARWLDATGPLPLWPLAAAGLAAGDDLHGSTQHANDALVVALRAQAATPGAAELADDVAATPLFFLTLCMAACALVLRAAEGDAPPTLVTRAGGNGETFGIAVAGRAQRWVGVAAGAPVGPRLSTVAEDVAIAGAIGDSAVIDLLGLGGQRLAHAPALRATLAAAAGLSDDAPDPVATLLRWPLPALAPDGRVGIDAADVVAQSTVPRVMLAMLAADGRRGLCGRGVYRPPLALFEAACGD